MATSGIEVQAEEFEVRLSAIEWASPTINVYVFAPVAGEALPRANAGSHIDITLPGGLVRQYSLLRPDLDRNRFTIAVKREADGRGGSIWLHDDARVGARLKASAPRNHFPLDESAPHSVLFAGGIGITPIWAMVQRLAMLGASWELHYAARSRDEAAFLDELADHDAQVNLHFDDEKPGEYVDLVGIMRRASADSHFYCCGPAAMLQAYEAAAAAAGIAPERVHLEYFTAKEEAATEGGFTIELARAGKEIFVPAGKTILDVVTEAGIRVPHSCTEGVCGSCETGVLRGKPDHRDSVLSAAERERGNVMMICCSGSLDDRLVLDL